MQALIKPIVVIFCVLYGLLWFGVEFEDVKRLLNGGDLFVVEKGVQLGLKDDIFDKCKLENGPLWTEYLWEWLDPVGDPMRSCNHSYAPWSSLLPDGRVRLTEACPNEAECRARAILWKGDYGKDFREWHEIREEYVFELSGREYPRSKVTKPASNVPKPPSVHIIVLDSIGSSHGRRVFHQTHRYLKDKFGAIELKHMNKVGENSRPNGMAFLLNKLITNIKRDIYGVPSVKAEWNYTAFCRTYLDDKGFILEEFRKAGYKTLMAEDWALGVFNWPGCHGFQKKPTTHYMRPFQNRLKMNVKELRDSMGWQNCFEPHLFLNDYHEKFIRAYPESVLNEETAVQYFVLYFVDSPKAALTWASDLGHDSPQKPFHADGQFRQFFERNKAEFDDSFVFFIGDHGLRFGWAKREEGLYSRDPVGARDVNNPMTMVSVPRRFRKDAEMMANLKQNSGELLTMFDTYATFIDILETFRDGGEGRNMSKTMIKPELKGSSFLRPLPTDPRNCKTLLIPPQYCICEITKEQLNITNDHRAIGDAIAANVNERLAEANISYICAELEMDKLTQLKRIVGATDLYDVTVQLRPGGGVFQTFVRGSNGEYSVAISDVTRLNKYNHDGDCTNINEIRPLCYCKSNLLPSSPARASPPRVTLPATSTKATTPRPSTHRPSTGPSTGPGSTGADDLGTKAETKNGTEPIRA
uniref:Uncharacterized protein n=1 Tax=Pristionchus pacificus TaxID=54126 RepID=A0A2A6BAS0_PRIPA|eukprot:PDM62985.1 hypothetical protein PRIPAC_50200 [Pristionchus pacificus]